MAQLARIGNVRPAACWLGDHRRHVQPDGKSLASGGNDGLVRLWETATGKEIRHFEGHKGNVDGLAFSSDGKTIVSGGTDNTACLWDVATGKRRLVLTGHTGAVNAVAFAEDGKLVATKARDATARLWDPTTGNELHSFPAAADVGTS